MNTVYEECWATHEALRRLNIPPDDIFVILGTLGAPPYGVFVEARQGEHKLAFLVGQIDVGPGVFTDVWKAFALTANAECNARVEYYQTLMERSLPFRDSARFVGALVLAGFKFNGMCVSHTRMDA